MMLQSLRTFARTLPLAVAVIGCTLTGTHQSPPPTSSIASSFKIVGYITPATTLSVIDFTKLTHVNYAFLLPRANGTLRPFGAPRHLQRTIELAHRAGVKVLISVGGWGFDEEFEKFAADEQKRARFSTLLVDFVHKNQLDGVDIDWEYPNAGLSATYFLALMHQLRTALPPPALLTTAVIARADDADGISPDVFTLVDYVNVMAYDNGSSDHSSYAFAQEAVSSWIARGLPKEKCILGVPLYARPGDVSYRKLLEYNSAAADGDHIRYFTTEQFYNGPETMRKKTRLAMREAGGIMIWELSQDAIGDASLLKVIAETAELSE